LIADGTTVLRNDDLRVRRTVQESAQAIQVDVKTAGVTVRSVGRRPPQQCSPIAI
jgi:glutamyl/glutaminyl-tRNA synthetase